MLLKEIPEQYAEFGKFTYKVEGTHGIGVFREKVLFGIIPFELATHFPDDVDDPEGHMYRLLTKKWNIQIVVTTEANQFVGTWLSDDHFFEEAQMLGFTAQQANKLLNKRVIRIANAPDESKF